MTWLEKLNPFKRKATPYIVDPSTIGHLAPSHVRDGSAMRDLRRLETMAMDRPLEEKSIRASELIPVAWQGKAAWSDWSEARGIELGYKASTWVFACAYRHSKAVASVPLVVELRKGDDWNLAPPNHPLVELISRPNEHWSMSSLKERLALHLLLGGNAIMTKVRAGKLPKELWLIAPDKAKPIIDRTGYISSYRTYRDGRPHAEIDPKDVCHIQLTDPANPWWGLSVLQAISRSVDTDREALDWQKVSFQNRAVPSGALIFDKPLTDTQYTEARTQLRDQIMGSDNAKMPLVLGNTVKWEQMSLSPSEMDFLESRKFTRVEICSGFGVPPPMIGIYDDATLANIETSRLIFWLDTIIPFLEGVLDALNLTLAIEYGKDVRLRYDVSGVQALEPLFNRKLDQAAKLVTMGYPLNEVNRKLGLGMKDVVGGDIGRIAANLVPIDGSGGVGGTGEDF